MNQPIETKPTLNICNLSLALKLDQHSSSSCKWKFGLLRFMHGVKHNDFCCFKGVTCTSPLHCVINWVGKFLHWFLPFFEIINHVTAINISCLWALTLNPTHPTNPTDPNPDPNAILWASKSLYCRVTVTTGTVVLNERQMFLIAKFHTPTG